MDKEEIFVSKFEPDFCKHNIFEKLRFIYFYGAASIVKYCSILRTVTLNINRDKFEHFSIK